MIMIKVSVYEDTSNPISMLRANSFQLLTSSFFMKTKSYNPKL